MVVSNLLHCMEVVFQAIKLYIFEAEVMSTIFFVQHKLVLNVAIRILKQTNKQHNRTLIVALKISPEVFRSSTADE